MGFCNHCEKEYVLEESQKNVSYSGGSLTITNFPVGKCDCGTNEIPEDTVLVSQFFEFLEENDMIGDITVSLKDLKSRFGSSHTFSSIGSIQVDGIEESRERMNWMKMQLKLNSDEELFSKALSLLHMAIGLEERGYTVKGTKKLGLFEGNEHISFKIRP